MSDQMPEARTSEPDRPVPPGVPRWVKVSGAIVLALILLFVVLRLTGLGGDHGPGRHMSQGAESVVTASGTATEGPWA